MKAILITVVLIVYSLFLFAQEDTYETTSARVDGIFYKAIYKSSDRSISIVKPKGKVVLHLSSGDRHPEGFAAFKFIDFDGDGYKDLLIEYMSNVPGRCDLALYNRQTRNFALLKDFPNYPNPQKLKGTYLYYSYHRSGCANLNWDSDFFKVANNKIMRMGNISGNGCEDEKTGIFISKIRGKKKTLVKNYHINEIGKYKDYKWGFIKQYWTRNYRKFI